VETDTLNSLVTSAIWRAEELEQRGICATQVWAEVSSLEQELARAIPPSDPEGQLARRGAVRAALKSADYALAQGLLESYKAESAAPESLKTALGKILAEADKAMKRRFRYAAKHHTPREAREMSLRLRARGAFGLAA
jgi:hypothetical protein